MEPENSIYRVMATLKQIWEAHKVALYFIGLYVSCLYAQDKYFQIRQTMMQNAALVEYGTIEDVLIRLQDAEAKVVVMNERFNEYFGADKGSKKR